MKLKQMILNVVDEHRGAVVISYIFYEILHKWIGVEEYQKLANNMTSIQLIDHVVNNAYKDIVKCIEEECSSELRIMEFGLSMPDVNNDFKKVVYRV